MMLQDIPEGFSGKLLENNCLLKVAWLGIHQHTLSGLDARPTRLRDPELSVTAT